MPPDHTLLLLLLCLVAGFLLGYAAGYCSLSDAALTWTSPSQNSTTRLSFRRRPARARRAKKTASETLNRHA